MILLKRFVLIIQFMTTIPLPIRIEANDEDFGKGLVFAPLVGLLIGGILSGSFLCLSIIFPVYISSVLVMIIYILLTGGLHLDGLGDTFDGLFSHRSKERMLEIMRDSRVGTNAVLAIVCLLLLNTSLISELNPSGRYIILVLMPAAGRIGSLIGAGISRYARSGPGLGKSFIDCCGIREVIPGALLYAVVFICIAGFQGFKTVLFPIVTAILLIKLFSSKIGGATGDVLGAVCEINQTLFLLAAFLIYR